MLLHATLPKANAGGAFPESLARPRYASTVPPHRSSHCWRPVCVWRSLRAPRLRPWQNQAWHGVPSHLERFDADFLERDFQSSLMRAVLSPAGMRHIGSPWFGRGNVLADELDAALFHGATFGQLGELEGRPYLIVGATDLSSGAEFDFTSDGLARLCSSINRVRPRIARHLFLASPQ